MIPYVENFLANLQAKMAENNAEDQALPALEGMRANLSKLKPVVEASDLDFSDLEAREIQMAELVHKFKKHLMIEKIRMEN